MGAFMKLWVDRLLARLNCLGFQWEQRHFYPLLWTLLVVVGAGILYKAVPNEVAQRFDVQWGFHLSLLVFVGIVLGLGLNAKDLWSRLKLHRPTWPVLGLLLVLLGSAGWYVSTHVELQHRVLSDETSWESMGLQMYYSHSGGVCNEGTWTVDGRLECIREVNNLKAKSTPLVYYFSSYFVEPSRDMALAVNLPVYLLSVALLFYAVFVLTGSGVTGLLAAAFLAFMPTMMFQARAASTEVLATASFNALLLVMALLLPIWRTKHLWLILPMLGFFAGTRLDAVFAFGAVVFVLWPWLMAKSWRLPTVVALMISKVVPMIPFRYSIYSPIFGPTYRLCST
jgi:hypothetical protein